MLETILHYLGLGIGCFMVLLFLASPFILAWCMWGLRGEGRRMAQWRWDRGIYTKWEARRARWKAAVWAWGKG